MASLNSYKGLSKEERRISHLRNVLSTIPLAPKDPILGLSEQFRQDKASRKVLLGAGAYRDNDGKPFVLPSVREAEQRLLDQKVNKEYAPIEGISEFIKMSLKFAYGADCTILDANRVAGCQSVGGTGANRVAAALFAKFLGKGHPIYIPNPTWGNHMTIYGAEGLDVRRYRYFNQDTRALDFEHILEAVRDAPRGSLFLLHACAHNPTGTDPTTEQWQILSREMKIMDHHVIFDCAYQGFATGDPEQDAYAIRLFVREGHNITLCQSFSKNFGLYGERTGCLSMVCANADERDRVLSQIKILVRGMYSNPPIHGANIVRTVLSDRQLAQQWLQECKAMSQRLKSMRVSLKHHLELCGSQRDWSHVTTQIGMFCYTGLTSAQVDALRDIYHIHMTQDGRISMAGVNTGNVTYVAEAIHAVTTVKQVGNISLPCAAAAPVTNGTSSNPSQRPVIVQGGNM